MHMDVEALTQHTEAEPAAACNGGTLETAAAGRPNQTLCIFFVCVTIATAAADCPCI